MTPGSQAAMPVLLVHGMGRTPLSLHRLARHLRRSGYDARVAGYVATVEPFARIVQRIRDRVAALGEGGQRYAVIGHSLGGLLLRAALAQLSAGALPSHLIMLGTPHRAPRLAVRCQALWPYRLINGECGQILAQPSFFDQLPPLAVPYTIIAGSRGWAGRGSPFMGEPNDGLVAVSETRVCRNDVPLVLPVRHTFMMNDSGVRAVIRKVLGDVGDIARAVD